MVPRRMLPHVLPIVLAATLPLVAFTGRAQAQVASGYVSVPTYAAPVTAPVYSPVAGTGRQPIWSAPRYWGGKTTYYAPATAPVAGYAPTGGSYLAAPAARVRRPLGRWWPAGRNSPMARPWPRR